MKYIFDFDDVLFNNTSQFKPYMYAVLERAGVPRAKAEKYYQTVREDGFSLRAFIKNLFVFENIGRDIEEVYREIMTGCSNFLNERLIEAVKRVGLENCYIVTNGDKEFQWDKLRNSGLANLFDEHRIRVVLKSKKEVIKEILAENPGQEFVFLDDKRKFLDELKDLPNLTTIHFPDFKKYPNLKTILYDERGLKKLMLEIKKK